VVFALPCKGLSFCLYHIGDFTKMVCMLYNKPIDINSLVLMRVSWAVFVML